MYVFDHSSTLKVKKNYKFLCYKILKNNYSSIMYKSTAKEV